MKYLLLIIALTLSTTANAQYIPDIMPVDVYLNLDKIGFHTEKDLGSEWGNFWTSTLKAGGLDFRVEADSDDVNKVQRIRATVMNANLNPSEAKQFIKYIASVLYMDDEAGKRKINQWIDSNYNKNATASFNGTSVKISSPSKISKILSIEAK